MKTFVNVFLAISITASLSALPKELLPSWTNPSLKDLETVQYFLDHELACITPNAYGFRTKHIQSFKLFSPNHLSYSLQIKKGKNSAICVTCYSSINPRYETDLYHTGLKRLLQSLEECNFSGDVLYRIGGWPNMEHEGLLLCDTPYAFKLCAFEEAFQLGYQQVLWLDLSVTVLTDLSQVFEKIKQDGAYFRKSFHGFMEHSGEIITPDLAQAYNRSQHDLEKIPHYASGILGFDLTNPKVIDLLADWHKLAKQKTFFQSCFPEQVPLSFLIDKYNLHQGLCPYEEIVFENHLIQKNTQFLIRY